MREEGGCTARETWQDGVRTGRSNIWGGWIIRSRYGDFASSLGEIETQLLAQPEVREAVVVAREGEGATGGARLVGYVSFHAGVEVEVARLREALAQVLPDYMLPSAIVVLERLPLNPNGKVDRKALPEPEFVGTDNYEAPQGEVEEALAGIWAQVLGMGQVGRHDNFFELGGDSILSLQIVTKVRPCWLEDHPPAIV